MTFQRGVLGDAIEIRVVVKQGEFVGDRGPGDENIHEIDGLAFLSQTGRKMPRLGKITRFKRKTMQGGKGRLHRLSFRIFSDPLQ